MATTAAMTKATAARAPRRFYLIMSFVLAGIVGLGFSHTVPTDLSSPGFPPFLIVHGLIFLAWMLLFIVQPALIGGGALALHRRLGWIGAGLAVAMVLLGAGAILLGLRSHHLPPFYPPGLFLFRGFLGLAVFSGLVIAGVLQRRRPEWHKRFFVCASIVVIVPGLERALPVPLMGAHWAYLVDGAVLALALAGPVVDLATRRRIHPAYIWGVGAILTGQIAVDLLTLSPLAPAAVHLVSEA